MGRIGAAVADYLAGREWQWERDDDTGRFRLPVVAEHGSWIAVATPLEADEQLLVHSILPTQVPADRLDAMARFLTRANLGLVLGNFELDLDDGQVRYKTSIDVEGAELVDALVDHLVLANVMTTDTYLPGIEAVAAGADPDRTAAELDA